MPGAEAELDHVEAAEARCRCPVIAEPADLILEGRGDPFLQAGGGGGLDQMETVLLCLYRLNRLAVEIWQVQPVGQLLMAPWL